MVSDDEADRLASVAVEFVNRIRDYDPRSNLQWIRATLPDPVDRERLLFVLAIAVPLDVPWAHLTGWTRVAPPPWEDLDEYRADLVDPALVYGQVA